jgi:hypothetical protein
MQQRNIESTQFRLLTNKNAEQWFLTADLPNNETGKLVILDNMGNLVSRQVVHLIKGENSIPVSKNTFSDAQLHVIILYLGKNVVFSQLVMNNVFMGK